ncbi:MAG: hypothetical protein LBS32_07660 [Clostridiales Family XIII bacterium]|nr:hypothetical protein [Clostridiales Family XIII bacterium]
MERRFTAAAATALAASAAYPAMQWLAYAERGYHAIGGEEALLAFGLFIALLTVAGGGQNGRNGKGAKRECGIKKNGLPESKPPCTESEQRGMDHFDASKAYHSQAGMSTERAKIMSQANPMGRLGR